MFKIFPATILPDGRKVPLINDWQNLATSNPETIKMWQELFRDRLTHWGIPTGPVNDILVLDVDVKGDGFKTLQEMNLPIPQTMSQKTISGGSHYIFKYPNDGKRYGNKVKFLPGLDTRGEGGYILHYAVDQSPIAPAPPWLLQDLRHAPSQQGTPIAVDPSIAGQIIQNCIDNIRNAPVGERNNTLNKEAFKIAQLVASGSITKDYASQILESAAKEIGLLPSEIHATISSAIKGGESKPLTSPFGQPIPLIDIPAVPAPERWTPNYFSLFDLTNLSFLKKPQLFQDWSTEDIHITTGDGGTGKTTLKLFEAVCLALGDRFLGFNCISPGKTLYITGEDTAKKLGAMIGAIARQMGVFNDQNKMNILLQSIVVKKDPDLCIISKDKQGFLHANQQAMQKLMDAVQDIKPKMIVFDPISSFWGSEAALNDMAKAVSKFMGQLVDESKACVEMINHMGKASSNNKDMTQFAGRGGSGLPSHARVSRALRSVFNDEYLELTGKIPGDGESTMMCNVNKFSDGSPLYNKPFLIVRNGFLFHREDLSPVKEKEEAQKISDVERVFNFIKEHHRNKRLPSKGAVIAAFAMIGDKLSEARVKNAINHLLFIGHEGQKIRGIENPDVTQRDRVYVVTDMNDKEIIY